MKDTPPTILTNASRTNFRLGLIVFCSLATLLSFIVLASFGAVPVKSSPGEDQLWRENHQVGSVSEAGPGFYRALTLNENAQRKLLRHAPMEFSKAAELNQVVMTLPMPDGKLARFRVEESPVMASRLAAMFPEIKTYRGQGLDDPTVTTRFDVTPAGFHAIVLSSQGTVIIEPAAGTRAGQYVSYEPVFLRASRGS